MLVKIRDSNDLLRLQGINITSDEIKQSLKKIAKRRLLNFRKIKTKYLKRFK